MTRDHEAPLGPRAGALRPKATARQSFRRALPLAALILFQSAIWIVFVLDAGTDMLALWPDIFSDWHMIPEIGATFGLLLAIVFEVHILLRMLRRLAGLEQGLRVAAGALAQIMEEYFQDWGLTPSEQDIAAFTIKGFSIAEIAELRGSAEGTVKTHLHAIYRKAGVAGRAQLVSLLVEDLLRAPLPEAGPTRIGNALPL
jgi:DNA-binding CsgD family transcriptional regulator